MTKAPVYKLMDHVYFGEHPEATGTITEIVLKAGCWPIYTVSSDNPVEGNIEMLLVGKTRDELRLNRFNHTVSQKEENYRLSMDALKKAKKERDAFLEKYSEGRK